MKNNFDTEEFTNDRSMVVLQPGDVVGPLEGRNYIVEISTPSRARLLPLTSEAKEVKFGDKTVSMSSYGRAVSISQRVSKEMLLERNGPEVLAEFLSAKKGGPRAGSNEQGNQNNNNAENQDNTMAKSTTSTPRGGLAAAAIAAKNGTAKAPKAPKAPNAPKAPKAPKDENGSKGKLGELFGNSITSVIRLLGSKGFTVGQVTKALKAQKITPAEATVKIQIGRGKQAKSAGGEALETLAKISKDQLAELTKDAGESEAPAKAKKADKAKAPKAKKDKAPKEEAPTEPTSDAPAADAPAPAGEAVAE